MSIAIADGVHEQKGDKQASLLSTCRTIVENDASYDAGEKAMRKWRGDASAVTGLHVR